MGHEDCGPKAKGWNDAGDYRKCLELSAEMQGSGSKKRIRKGHEGYDAGDAPD
jgi:hypothetical protein